MATIDPIFIILLHDGLFVAIASSFFAIVGWAWKSAKPYDLPHPLPRWFKVWFLSVQILGIFPPLAALILGGIIQGNSSVLAIFSTYFAVLALQILTESLTLRQFNSVVWVMVPYLYVPYRVWQLYAGLTVLESDSTLFWVRSILYLEIIVWLINYGLDLAQLPRLLRWEVKEEG
jgi:hypothetical protein